MNVRRVGRDAVLVDCASQAEVQAWYRAVLERGLPATDVVPGARSLLLDGLSNPDGLIESLGSWAVDQTPEPAGGEVVLDITYDGPDLEFVAEHCGRTIDDVIEAHAAGEYSVAFCGFAPGFAYLVGSPFPAMPRRSEPRTKVPAGAVGLAGEFTGIYPRSSPGGWQLIGTVTADLWDLARDEPALLAPGARVRFRHG